MQKFTYLVILILLLQVSQAQNTQRSQAKSTAYYLDIDLMAGIPQGDFQTYNDNIAFGGGVNFYFQPSIKIPILVGLDLNFLGNGSKSETETLEADITAGGTLIDKLYFPLRIDISNTIFSGHFDMRFLAPTKIFRPYIDGSVGFTNFSTSTSIYDESDQNYFTDAENNLITSKTQLSDWTFSYGGAVGLLIEFNQSVMLDVRCAYMKGGEAEYFVKDDIQNWDVNFNVATFANPDDINSDDIDVSAIPEQSETDMIMPSLGLTFKF